MAVKIVPEHPFLSCNCPTNDFSKTSNVSEFIFSELITKKPVEHKALSKSLLTKAMLARAPSMVARAELLPLKKETHIFL